MKIKNLTVDWVVTDPATDKPINFSLDIETSRETFIEDVKDAHSFARAHLYTCSPEGQKQQFEIAEDSE